MVNVQAWFFVLLTSLVIFNTLCNLMIIKYLGDVYRQIDQFSLIAKGAATIVKSCTDVIAKAAEEAKDDKSEES